MNEAHDGDSLRAIAKTRGIEHRLDQFTHVRCRECGASGELRVALFTMLGHWPECLGEDADIEFVRTRRLFGSEVK